VNMQIRVFLAVMAFGGASVALAQGSGAPVDVSKIAAKLKQLDTNSNGIIEQDEADKGGGVYIEMRVFRPANVTPHYPISINDLLQIAGGQAPSGAGSAAGDGPSPSPVPAASVPAASSAAAAPISSGGTASGGAPTAAPASSTPTPPAAPSTASSSPTVAKPAVRSSGKWHTAKELLPKGLPDWFLAKADADGQIMMAEYTDRWTPEAVAQFEKYDLNHDGIITAAEVLKVEKTRGKR
jgi:hypothetical protein